MEKVLIAPSVLNVPQEKLCEQSNILEKFGADWLHCDAMDGIFVPNTALSSSDVADLKKSVNIPLDIHLMYQHPMSVVEDFANAGADIITFHVETADDVEKTSELIRKCGAKVGLALNPSTPVDVLLPYADCFDMILIMSVQPGLGGQRFKQESVEKIRRARELFSNKLIEVDGGINAETAKLVVEAGVDVLVAGSFIILAQNIGEAIGKLKNL